MSDDPISTGVPVVTPKDHGGVIRFRGRIAHLTKQQTIFVQQLLVTTQRWMSRKEIKDAVWGHVHISPDSVTVLVHKTRKVLAPLDLKIECLQRNGYKLLVTQKQTEAA